MAVFKPENYKKGITIYAISVTGDTISKWIGVGATIGASCRLSLPVIQVRDEDGHCRIILLEAYGAMPKVNNRPPMLFTTRKSAEKGRPVVRAWFENIMHTLATLEDQEDNPHPDHGELETVS